MVMSVFTAAIVKLQSFAFRENWELDNATRSNIAQLILGSTRIPTRMRSFIIFENLNEYVLNAIALQTFVKSKTYKAFLIKFIFKFHKV